VVRGSRPGKGRKASKGLKSLDQFDASEVIRIKNGELAAMVQRGNASKVQLTPVVPTAEHMDNAMRHVRKERLTNGEKERQRRLKIIEEEINRGGTTVNIKRCFLTDLRVSAEVYEEIRVRIIHDLELAAKRAEEAAIKRGSRTIQLQEVI
jgi:hypothetical protein